MSRRFALAWLLIGLAGLPARAQVPVARDLLPTRTALARLGLERQCMAIVPLSAGEKVLMVSVSDGLIFAQSNLANFHVFDAETGQQYWTAKVGMQSGRARPASVNSFAVFVTNANYIYALDRGTGRTIWSDKMDSIPSGPTACDEERVYVGLSSGRVLGYYAALQKIKIAQPNGSAKEVLKTTASLAWNWQTNLEVIARPQPAGAVVAFGSVDGKVYVAESQERKMLYRFATGGQIRSSMGTYGTRTLLVPSTDQNLYALDIWSAKPAWVFSTGAPVEQEPLVADDDVYMVNKAGILSAVDAKTGVPRWNTSTHGGRLLSVSARRLYLESSDDDLFLVDRATGQTLADPRATFSRVGLNLRSFAFAPTNHLDDRLYFGTTSGLIVCVREIGQTTPRLLRAPKAPPFGYIPPEGLKIGPDGTAVLPGQVTAPAAAPPAAPDAEKKEEDAKEEPPM